MESPGDHEVKDEPKIAVQSNRDALSDAPQLPHDTAFSSRNRRLGGSQQERVGYPDVFERPADDAVLQRADVRGDIRELGHS